MSNHILTMENVSKKFCTSLKKSLFYGFIDTTKSMVGLSYNTTSLRNSEFWALRHINFQLEKGVSLGVIGRNGSGKSTLLRLIGGVYPPSEGKITLNGRLGALISAGVGFHPHMTGRENIYLNGALLGMRRKEINTVLLDIIDFAEIKDFIDSPVALYSSGMTIRLGFSIAIHAHVDILIADEILAVGDSLFRLKCYKKLTEMRNNGVSILMVNHDIALIAQNCHKALWLDHGEQKSFDNVDECLNLYQKTNNTLMHQIIEQSHPNFTITHVDSHPKMIANTCKITSKNHLKLAIHSQCTLDFPNVECEVKIYNEFLPTKKNQFFITSKELEKIISFKAGDNILHITLNHLPIEANHCILQITLWINEHTTLLAELSKFSLVIDKDSHYQWSDIHCDFQNNPASPLSV